MAREEAFYQRPKHLVTEALDAAVMLGEGKFAGLGYPAMKVVVRADWGLGGESGRDRLGGGAGHEPAQAGFVGDEMLTAAV